LPVWLDLRRRSTCRPTIFSARYQTRLKSAASSLLPRLLFNHLFFQFSIASPGEYARGTPIHCYLSVTSTDSEALDLLASSKTCNISLYRRLTADDSRGITVLRASKLDLVSEGRLWPASPTNLTPDTRLLFGEIPVTKEVHADFTIPSVSLTVGSIFSPIPTPGSSIFCSTLFS
jgi:hypothetical protein